MRTNLNELDETSSDHITGQLELDGLDQGQLFDELAEVPGSPGEQIIPERHLRLVAVGGELATSSTFTTVQSKPDLIA